MYISNMMYALVDLALNITKGAPDLVLFRVTSNPFDIVPFLPPIIAGGIGGGIAWLIHRSQKKIALKVFRAFLKERLFEESLD